jgi:hypothetical protein
MTRIIIKDYKRSKNTLVKDCEDESLYPIKKLLYYSGKADITIEITRTKGQMKGQRDFDGNEIN